MKKFNELDYDEKKEVSALFANWLKDYTYEVIKHVMARAEEILNNEFAMNMLRELAKRENQEKGNFTRSIEDMLYDFKTFGDYDPRNHVLEHSKSYRDVLYDMYIRGYSN